MQDERRERRDDQLNQRRRKEDAKFEVTEDIRANNLHREVWSPLDFDKKYLELAKDFLKDDDDKIA